LSGEIAADVNLGILAHNGRGVAVRRLWYPRQLERIIRRRWVRELESDEGERRWSGGRRLYRKAMTSNAAKAWEVVGGITRTKSSQADA
jgi:hypothetical protein